MADPYCYYYYCYYYCYYCYYYHYYYHYCYYYYYYYYYYCYLGVPCIRLCPSAGQPAHPWKSRERRSAPTIEVECTGFTISSTSYMSTIE